MVVVNSKQPGLPCEMLVVNHFPVSVTLYFRENDGDGDDDDDDDDDGGVAPAA